ncbi:MAG TPA: DUF2007 domain-containing protein [Actinomycetota bacterium]|nr:DUF2007 domain-containing protein [Actinomycetota bacterium]
MTVAARPRATRRATPGGGQPPPRDDGGRGGGSGWVELVRATDDIDAHLLAGRLLEAGIETLAVKDRRAPGAWLSGGSNPWAPVTVLVRRLQLDDARLVLAEISYGAPPAPEPGAVVEPRAPRRAWRIAVAVVGIVVTALVLAESTHAMAPSGAPSAPRRHAGV